MKCLYSGIIFFLLLFLGNAMEVSALNTGLVTTDLTRDEKSRIISNIDLSLLEEEPEKSAIQSFDVNDNEQIALGHGTSDKKVISIYSHEGDFQYGYMFDCTGDFGVEWDGEYVNIYFARSSLIVSVDASGNIEDVLEVEDTIDNNSYINNFIYLEEKVIGDKIYVIKNDMGVLNWVASSYSQLVVKQAGGEEVVLYDVNATQFTKTLTIGILTILFFILAVTMIIRQILKAKR